MTCIVGLVDKGTVWMGGDSAGVAGLDLSVRKDPKVFRIGSLLIGYTTSFRMGQLLRYGDAVSTAVESADAMARDPFEAMVRHFVPAVRTLFKDGGFAEKENERERGGTFLVGYRGRLFSVEGDYQVGELVDPFDACGCGESFARGALAATPKMKPKERLRLAMEVAERFSAGVRGPFTILSLEAK